MKLPILDTYAFPVVVPSTSKSIAMRPFLVREEKLLLMAQESKNTNDQIEAVAQVIRNCTNGAIEPKDTPYFDIEYLMLQLRIRSVGEIATPIYRCNHINPATGAICGHEQPVPINLTEIGVTGLEKLQTPTVVTLSSKYTLSLKYPTIYTINALVAGLVDGKQLFLKAIEGIPDIFDVLTDTETNATYVMDEFSNEDKLEFLENLETGAYDQFIDFLVTMPTVTHTVAYTCSRCQFEHTLTFSGVSDFLQ